MLHHILTSLHLKQKGKKRGIIIFTISLILFLSRISVLTNKESSGLKFEKENKQEPCVPTSVALISSSLQEFANLEVELDSKTKCNQLGGNRGQR